MTVNGDGPATYHYPEIVAAISDGTLHGRSSRCPNGVRGYIAPSTITAFEPQEGVYELHMFIELDCIDGVVCRLDTVLPNKPAVLRDVPLIPAGTRVAGSFQCTPPGGVGPLSIRLT